jgi:hypothetical protein
VTETRIAERGKCPFCGKEIFMQHDAGEGKSRLSHETPTCERFKAKLAALLGRPAVMENRTEVVVISLEPKGEA